MRLSSAILPENFDIERVIHSIKTAFACLIGFILTRLIDLPMSQWLIISIVVVMCAQINVGSVINKSYMRFLGTLSGSLLAAITLGIFQNNEIANAAAVTFSALLFSYIATSETSYSDSGTLGAVTVITILLGQHPTITTAAHRFLEISIGILIAALVSQFILPIRARDHLVRAQAKTLNQFREFYIDCLVTESSEEVTAKYMELDEAIAKSLSAQRSLAKQARREPLGTSFDPQHFGRILRCEKEIFRSIVCMRYAYDMLPRGRMVLSHLPAIKHFHQLITETFEKIATAIEQKNFTSASSTIPSLQPVKEAIIAVSKTLSSDDLIYLNGFLFCAELLIVHLTELVILLEKVKTAPSN